MPQPYLKPLVEINIGHAYGGFREDNWNVPNGGNVWIPDGGVTFTTDGDVASGVDTPMKKVLQVAHARSLLLNNP